MSEIKVDPKEIEKVQKLLSDEEFVKKLISQETIEDAKKLFEDQGIKTNIEEMKILRELIKEISNNSKKELSEDDLEEISGGVSIKNGLRKVKNGIVRTGGTVIGAVGGAIQGTFSGTALGTIAGAVAGYKIAGKWCS